MPCSPLTVPPSAQREVEQLLRGRVGARALRRVARVEQEGRVHVAVAGVAPRAGLEVVARADRAAVSSTASAKRSSGHRDVLGELRAADAP